MDTFLTILLFLVPMIVLLVGTNSGLLSKKNKMKIPPGSLGFPIIGQSFSFLKAMRDNNGEAWLQERVNKYGPISKLSLFGQPTVFIYGRPANKFVFNSPDVLSNRQTKAMRILLGDQTIMELTGEDHKRVREALQSFLKHDILKGYVGKMDEEMKKHLHKHWEGKEKVTVMPLMKTLTFNMICSLVLGIESVARRDELVELFEMLMKGVWTVPINFPFSNFSCSLRASTRLKGILKELIREKKAELEEKRISPTQEDLITCLLKIHNKDKGRVMSEEEIIQNVLTIMIAGYDTTSNLLTFIIRLMDNDKTTLAGIVEEQESIAKSKSPEEPLTWEDLGKMKYTWRVALETLRTLNPVFGSFREAKKDIEYEGYLIPRGWKIFWVAGMTHMDEKIFKEASKFSPARFEDQASIPPYSFVAFGGGYRVCPGNDFAKFETLVAIHYLVTRFTWKLDCKDNSFIRNPMLEPAHGLPIRIFPKK